MSEVSADDRDLAIRTMLGEEGSEVGQAGVAAVILNRLAAGSYGESIGDVIDAPGQFNGRPHKGTWQSTASRDDPRYVAAGQLFDAVRDGSLPDPTNGATYFYAPTAQARLALVDGRPVTPKWAQGRGLKLGSSMFYAPQGRVDRKPEEPGFKVDFSQIAKSPNQIAAEFPIDQLPPGATLFQPSGPKAASKAVEFPFDQLPPGAEPVPKAAPQEGADEFSDPITAEAYRRAHEPLHDRRYPSPPSLPGAFMGPPEEPLAGVVLDPSLPIGVRGLAAASQEGLNFARAPFEMTQQQAQRIRQGNPLMPQDAGGIAMNAGMLGAREAPGGAAATRGMAPDVGVAFLGPKTPPLLPPPDKPVPGAASPTLRPSAGEIPPAPPPSPPRAGIEPREFPRDQLPPGAEPVKPPAELRPGAPRLVLREELPSAEFGGTVLPEVHNFSIVDEKGDAIGDVAISPRKETKTLVVDWVGDPEGKEQLNLGPAATRGMLRQLAEQYPDYDWVQGFRTGGTRRKSGEGSAWTPRIRLRSESDESHALPPSQLPPGAEPVEPSMTGGEAPTTIQFRGKTYSGATKLDAVTAAQRATGISLDRIWDEGKAAEEVPRAAVDATLSKVKDAYDSIMARRDNKKYTTVYVGDILKESGVSPEDFHDLFKGSDLPVTPGGERISLRSSTYSKGKRPVDINGHSYYGISFGNPAEPRTDAPPGILDTRGKGQQSPVTIQFRGKTYSGATKLDAIQAAHAANPDVGLEHISNAVTPETTAADVDAFYAARRAQAAPGNVGAAVTPPSALLPPAAPEPKISVTQPVRNFAHAIRAIFDAPGVSDEAKAAGGLIRESRGMSKRAAEQARTTLEPFMRQVRRLSVDGRFKLVDYIETRIEGGRAWFMKDTTLQPVADALREVLWRVRNTMEDMPSEARMGFVENYFPHQWVDPKKAGEFVRQWVARMGEGGFTKKRSIPTVLDGIRAGLVPRTVDPIEAVLLYIENAYQFIAHNRTFNEAKDAGFIKLAAPGDQPEGWVRLNGRLADKGFVKAWAPEDFARVYNNALSTLAGPAGDVINGLRRAFNIITGIELAWPGFHMSAMAMESIANKIASALSDATRWRLDQTAIKLATAPAAPITMLRRGAEAQRIYRSLTDGSAEMREIVDLLARADFRFVGKGRAADEYRFSGADNYFKAIRRGTLLTELNADLKRAGRQPIVGTAAVVLRNIGRAMETVTAPLFEYAIPKLKSGAAVELMANWLRGHPNATVEAKLAHAREIANVIDDRFGEMNHDSLFWHANLRAGAQMALLSFSWEMGFLRTVVGGSIDWAKFPFTHRQTERMGYLIALPLAIAAVNGASTYLHTGEAPSGMDFVAARTGGKNPDGSPERASIPSWARNVLAWVNVLSGPKRGSLADELYGMANPGVKDVIDFARNSDWHGDPIFSSAPDAPPWLKQFLQHIVEQHIPMPLQLGTQPKPGTGITGLESLLGVRPAPFFMQEPDLYQSIYDKKNVKEWKAAQKFRERQRVLHGQ